MGFDAGAGRADGKCRVIRRSYRDLRGRQRSAGTFATQRQADRAWQRAEAQGRPGPA